MERIVQNVNNTPLKVPLVFTPYHVTYNIYHGPIEFKCFDWLMPWLCVVLQSKVKKYSTCWRVVLWSQCSHSYKLWLVQHLKYDMLHWLTSVRVLIIYINWDNMWSNKRNTWRTQRKNHGNSPFVYFSGEKYQSFIYFCSSNN